jgi:DNA-binding NtrC family response regulator
MGGRSQETTVLVVDDDESMRLLCRVNLELEGYHVLEAASVESAKDVLEREPVRVILLDVHIGAGDGRALLRRLRETRPDIPVAFLTGSIDAEELGRDEADGVLMKPFKLEQLSRLVGRLASR